MSNRTVLIVGNRLIGDTVDALHAVVSLYKKNSKARYLFIGYHYTAFLYEHCVPFYASFYLDRPKNISWFGKIRRLVLLIIWCWKIKGTCDLAFILPGGFGWGLLSFLIRAKECVGHSGDYRSFFLTRKKEVNPLKPNFENFDDLFLLLYPHDRIQRATLPAKKFDLNSFGLKNSFVVFSVMASESCKIWEREKFIDLARRVKTTFKVDIVFIGSKLEREQVEFISSQDEVDGVNLAGKLDLEEAFYLISRSCFLVGNDSGLTHVAALLEVTSFSISGHGNPTLNLPFSLKKNTHFIYQEDPNIPHYLRKKKKFAQKFSVSKISVDTVWNEIQTYINPLEKSPVKW